jgi:hypothetical protein
MRNRNPWTLFVSLFVILIPFDNARAQGLNENLRPFERLLGSWQGRFQETEEALEVNITYEIILNGWGVRCLKRVPEAGDHATETTYYWDERNQVIVFISLTNNGWRTIGAARFEGQKLLTEGVQNGPDLERATSGVFELLPDGSLREGVSGRGHVILYHRGGAGTPEVADPV